MKTELTTTQKIEAHVASDILHKLANDDMSLRLDAVELIGGSTHVTATVSVRHKWLDDYVSTLDLGTFTTYKALNRTLVERLIYAFRNADADMIGAQMMTKAVRDFDADDNEMDGSDYAEIVQFAAELGNRFQAMATSLEIVAEKLKNRQAA